MMALPARYGPDINNSGLTDPGVTLGHGAEGATAALLQLAVSTMWAFASISKASEDILQDWAVTLTRKTMSKRRPGP